MSPRQVNFSEPASLRRSTPRANNTRHEQVNASYLTEATSLDFTALLSSLSFLHLSIIYIYITIARVADPNWSRARCIWRKRKKKERKKEKRNKGKRRRRRRKREGKKGGCDGPLSSASALCRPGGEGREGKKKKKREKNLEAKSIDQMEILFLHDYSRRPFQPALPIATPSIYYNIYIYIIFLFFFDFVLLDRCDRGRSERDDERERERERESWRSLAAGTGKAYRCWGFTSPSGNINTRN